MRLHRNSNGMIYDGINLVQWTIGVIHNNVLQAYTSSIYFKFEVYA